MNIAINSWRYRTLAKMIADQSRDDGICIDLDITRALADNQMIFAERLTGDCCVTLDDLQAITDIFCASLDVINY